MILHKKKGFSLVEVMVVIAIMTILMMAAISSFTFFYKTFAETRLTNLQKLIEYSVIRARTDNETVIICAADAEASFDKQGKLDSNTFKCFTGKDSTNWGDKPIIAFESPNDNTIYNAADGDTIIGNLGEGHDESLYINLSGSPSYIRISPNGFMATGNGNITYCDRSNKYQAALIINLVGRVVYTDSKTKDGGGVYTCE